MKKITLTFLFLISFVSLSFGQFSENFDAGVTLPAGWSVINGGDTNTWTITTPGTGTANSGTNVARINYDAAVAHNDYLITPQFTVTAGTSDQLSLWAKHRSDTYSEPFDILLSTASANAVDFTTIVAAAVTPNTTWQKFTYSLSAYAGQTVYIAFKSTTLNQWELYLDDVVVGATPAPPEYVNLQYPATATILQGNNVTVYGQIYKAGLTDVAPNIVGQAPGITAWVGISPIGSNTNPNTWTNWVASTWNSGAIGNNDEYQASIGVTLAPGTYYYATRFSLNGGPYFYGGIDASNNGNFWNGTNYISGVLTVNAPPPPANDNCAGAIALTPGGVFADNAVTGTTLAATTSTVAIPNCPTIAPAGNSDVWYSVAIPASGTVTVETQASATNSLTDTVIVAYSGTCGSLTPITCNDDATTVTNLFSKIIITGTAGDIVYVGVWKYGTIVPSGTVNGFKISAYDGSLGNSSFDNANFAFYPNPVKNILNLSYIQEISSVEIFNLLGQKVNSNKINANSAQIDMSNLSKGAYMVKVTSNDQVKTIKVIKE